MKQTELRPTVRDLLPGYMDDEVKGCFAMDGKLCIRPEYQREFVYSDKQRDLVIDTVNKGMPLGLMYWMKKPNGGYELMDGQQRTLSLLQYCAGNFSISYKFIHNLSPTEQDRILSYKLMVCVCEGTDEERREWFQRINIANATLTNQEILNSVYSGPWCQDAKKYFSKPGGPAVKIGDKYVRGSAIRQEYLETALEWLCLDKNIVPAEYMAQHQNDATALELWSYYRAVIDWAESLFGRHYRKLMLGLPWGEYYHKYRGNAYNPADLEARLCELEQDEELQKLSGIYEYVLSGDERCLSFRQFPKRDVIRKLSEQGDKCALCGCELTLEQAEGDHITPWAEGGLTEYDNLQVLCRKCNRTKGKK